ncbi:hypothetical protein N8529_00130 [bacterium]|nr:hypothetical protein [bacterium]
MARAKKGIVKRAIITPDKHVPIHDKKALSVVKQAIKIVKPDIYVDLGDLGEWASCSRFKWKTRKKPPLEHILPDVYKDIEDVNSFLDEMDKVLDSVGCKERHITTGNHDEWLNTFNQEHPYLGLSFKKACKFQERGWKCHPAGKYLKLGKLYVYHGHHYASAHHAANHLRKLGCNIMYGHHHGLQQASVTHIDGPKSAWSVGCLKDMSSEQNKWLGNKQTNWSHAFAVVDFYKGGKFTVHIIQIVDGQASLWGELITGKA